MTINTILTIADEISGCTCVVTGEFKIGRKLSDLTFPPKHFFSKARTRVFLSVAWSTGVQLVVFLCSRYSLALFDFPGISSCQTACCFYESLFYSP